MLPAALPPLKPATFWSWVWHLATIFNQPPLIAYKRDTNNSNICDMLVWFKLHQPATRTPGTTLCNHAKCGTCSFICTSTNVTGTELFLLPCLLRYNVLHPWLAMACSPKQNAVTVTTEFSLRKCFFSLTDCIKLQTEWEGKTNNTNTSNSKNSISTLEMN